MRRMMKEQENIYYYITAMNENYVQPPMPEGTAELPVHDDRAAAREDEGERSEGFGEGAVRLHPRIGVYGGRRGKGAPVSRV